MTADLMTASLALIREAQIEAAARAMHDTIWGYEGAGKEVSWLSMRHGLRRHAIAALEAAEAATTLGGYRLVPISALEWLNGSGPDADGNWFGDATPSSKGKYWWRSYFMDMIDAADLGRAALRAPDAQSKAGG